MQKYYVGQTVYVWESGKKVICELKQYTDKYMYIKEKTGKERVWEVPMKEWCVTLYPRLTDEFPLNGGDKKRSTNDPVVEEPERKTGKKKETMTAYGSEKKNKNTGGKGRSRTKKKSNGKKRPENDYPDIYRPTDVIPGAGFTGKRRGSRSKAGNDDRADHWEDSRRKRCDDGDGVMDLPLDKRERQKMKK